MGAVRYTCADSLTMVQTARIAQLMERLRAGMNPFSLDEGRSPEACLTDHAFMAGRKLPDFVPGTPGMSEQAERIATINLLEESLSFENYLPGDVDISVRDAMACLEEGEQSLPLAERDQLLEAFFVEALPNLAWRHNRMNASCGVYTFVENGRSSHLFSDYGGDSMGCQAMLTQIGRVRYHLEELGCDFSTGYVTQGIRYTPAYTGAPSEELGKPVLYSPGGMKLHGLLEMPQMFSHTVRHTTLDFDHHQLSIQYTAPDGTVDQLHLPFDDAVAFINRTRGMQGIDQRIAAYMELVPAAFRVPEAELAAADPAQPGQQIS